MSIPIHALISQTDQIAALDHQIERLQHRNAELEAALYDATDGISGTLLRDEIESLRSALDGLLEYVSTTEEAKRWDSISTPGVVVTAVAALVGTCSQP